MPTNNKERLNISIVDSYTISELTKLRNQLEDATEKRLSLADTVNVLIRAKPSLRDLVLAIN